MRTCDCPHEILSPQRHDPHLGLRFLWLSFNFVFAGADANPGHRGKWSQRWAVSRSLNTHASAIPTGYEVYTPQMRALIISTAFTWSRSMFHSNGLRRSCL